MGGNWEHSRRRITVMGLMLLGGFALPGCGNRLPDRLELTSYRDPYFPDKYDIVLDELVFRREPTGDLHICGVAKDQSLGEIGGSVEQLLHIHTFWRPRPGKTFADPSSVDAIIEYVIATSGGVCAYSGAGFVYVNEKRDGDLGVQLKQSRLRVRAMLGDCPDLIERGRLIGRFQAEPRDGRAAEINQRLQMLCTPANFAAE